MQCGTCHVTYLNTAEKSLITNCPDGLATMFTKLNIMRLSIYLKTLLL